MPHKHALLVRCVRRGSSTSQHSATAACCGALPLPPLPPPLLLAPPPLELLLLLLGAAATRATSGGARRRFLPGCRWRVLSCAACACTRCALPGWGCGTWDCLPACLCACVCARLPARLPACQSRARSCSAPGCVTWVGSWALFWLPACRPASRECCVRVHQVRRCGFEDAVVYLCLPQLEVTRPTRALVMVDARARGLGRHPGRKLIAHAPCPSVEPNLCADRPLAASSTSHQKDR
jgi:hypothetical protein